MHFGYNINVYYIKEYIHKPACANMCLCRMFSVSNSAIIALIEYNTLLRISPNWANYKFWRKQFDDLIHYALLIWEYLISKFSIVSSLQWLLSPWHLTLCSVYSVYFQNELETIGATKMNVADDLQWADETLQHLIVHSTIFVVIDKIAN